ncbi:Gfo/Idh/MocA family oxidoreductase [bacterium]|nr:Gfo/Idh/MocA family oxidoreductase [bacterium]
MSDEKKPDRIKLGMVGGGRDAFIGGVHRIASRLDDHYELVAGAFSSTAEKSSLSALDLGVEKSRAYASFIEMAKIESARDDGIEAVSIVTPNHLHFAAAKAFLQQGIHVICDKPLTSSLDDARTLVKIASKSKALFVLTHNYTGYPMMRQARAMVEKGGARGMLWSSQVAAGNENALRLRVYGSKDGIEWAQEDPNYLWFTPLGEPKRLLICGGSGATDAANAGTRVPGGHPEGYLEGFANLYTDAAHAIIAHRQGGSALPDSLLPTVYDGLAGVAFVSAVVTSSKEGGVWKSLDLS